jgi:outer membrane protein OmpA-like peptidoglycan-associated protein
MKKVTIFFIIVVLVGAIAIVATSAIMRSLKKREDETIKAKSSDAAKLTDHVRIAGDGWIGYSLFRSPEFKRYLESESIGLAWTDDQANYPDRMAKLAAGEYDLIATTLDAYILNARTAEYPGVVIFVVDESKGGDGIVAVKDIKAIADLAAPGTTIALTPNSPSDFFLRSVATHFDLAPLKSAGPWRKEANGSTAALKELRAGSVKAAVLWEPELTEAASDPRFHKLIGTEKTQGLIVDVCVASRKLVVEKPELVQTVTRSYFQALRYYQADEAALLDLAAKDSKTTPDKAKTMLGGVQFASLTQNATQWFGIGDQELVKEGLLNSIRANVDVLVDTKALSSDPFADTPRAIINSQFLEAALQQPGGSKATAGVFTGTVDATPAVRMNFKQLTDEQWAALRILGKLKIRPIVFQSGTSLLALDGRKEIDRIAQDLALYPSYRLLVRGHTRPEGDEQQNILLSQQRAEAVMNYLIRVHDIPAARVRSEGVGGKEPLPQEEGETPRRWQGRLPRVEILLVEDPSI